MLRHLRTDSSLIVQNQNAIERDSSLRSESIFFEVFQKNISPTLWVIRLKIRFSTKIPPPAGGSLNHVKNNEIINLKGEMKIEYYAAGVFKTPLPWMMILAHPLILGWRAESSHILVQKKTTPFRGCFFIY